MILELVIASPVFRAVHAKIVSEMMRKLLLLLSLVFGVIERAVGIVKCQLR